VDGILNTGASLLAMCKHCSNNYQLSHCQDDLLLRISKAKKYYSKLLYEWDVEQTSHVAFEILVPSLLELLKNEGLHFDFPGLEKLLRLREEKLARFNLNVFYSSNRISALHSLEGFVGKIDFDRIEHQKVHGSMMASPAATAAYLMFKAEWDEEAEKYLRHTISAASGKGCGGVPSAFPSQVFELSWVCQPYSVSTYRPANNVQAISTLHGNGVCLEQIPLKLLNHIRETLQLTIHQAGGVVGFGKCHSFQ
jgi:hypothetical protein